MTLPVPGGILAQLAPVAGQMDPKQLGAIMAMANAQGGQNAPQNPGAAIAPPAVQPPTVASNVNLAVPPADHIDGPSMADVAAGLPQADIPQHHGILGSIGDKLHDPNFRAEALRFAMGAFKGGAAGGLEAATTFADQRRAQAEDQRRFDAETGLKGRGLDIQQQGTNQEGEHYQRSDANSRAGILSNYQLGREGHQVEERNSIRSNTTSRLNNHEDALTSRANTGDTVRASILNNNTDNATARDVATGRNATDLGVATITSGAKKQLDPKDAMSMVGRYLPGALGTDDVEGVVKALQAAPDLQAQLADAATRAYGNGDGNAEERVQQAIKATLGHGASYTDDNSYLPFHGSPEITRGQPAAQGNGGKQIVRTGTDKATGKKVVQYSDGTISYAD
jgi:hypothetical protein